MASLKAIVFLSILLLLHPTTTLSDFLSPLLAPIFDEVCKVVACGKGKCITSQNSTFSYECECDPGWKQARADHDHHLKFLPCVIPNCTFNHACAAAPAPFQDKRSKANTSIFDPCHWANCRGGSCNKTSTFTYNCVCAEGFYNLLNVTAFPCYQECEIGMDCAGLGIPITNKSTAPNPALPDNINNQDEVVCKGVACGKGKCKPSQNGTFPYECECDAGWKQTHADNDHHLKFLPCVIPNCTLNHGCAAAPSPIQFKGTNANSSVFDPCHWADCGGGSCNKTSTFTYNCVCAEGFDNILNVSGFPCFQECSIGLDCANLGISMANKSRAMAPVFSVSGNGQAGSNLLGDYHWLIILLVSLAMVN